jgi:hypothetical protein
MNEWINGGGKDRPPLPTVAPTHVPTVYPLLRGAPHPTPSPNGGGKDRPGRGDGAHLAHESRPVERGVASERVRPVDFRPEVVEQVFGLPRAASARAEWRMH